MAILQNFNQQDDDKKTELGQPINVSGVSAPSAAPSGPSSSSSAAPTIQGAPTSSGRFQNIQNYLDANKDYNKQGGGFAGQITGDLGKQKDQSLRNVQDTQQQWTIQNQSKDIDPTQAGQFVNSGIQNATQFTQDPNQVNQFQQYLNAKDQYVAPEQYDASQQLANQVQNYQTRTNQVDSESGRYALLKDMYNNPSYNQGQQKLDNVLLQTGRNDDGTSQLAQLDQAKNYAQDLNSAYTGAAQNTQDLAAQYANNAQMVQDTSRGALGSSITDFGTQAKAAADKAVSDRTLAYQEAQARLGTGQVNNSDLNALKQYGINQGSYLYGIDPSKYLQSINTTPTVNNIITPEQQQRIEALSKLAGTTLAGDPNSVISQFNGNTQAGTFDSTPYTLLADQLSNDLNKNKAKLAEISGLNPVTVSNENVRGWLPYIINHAQKVYDSNVQNWGIDSKGAQVAKQDLDEIKQLANGQSLHS